MVQGTRTWFNHPSEAIDLAAFARVEVSRQTLADQGYFVVALGWGTEQRPRRFAHLDALWLETTEDADHARQTGQKLALLTGL